MYTLDISLDNFGYIFEDHAASKQASFFIILSKHFNERQK